MKKYNFLLSIGTALMAAVVIVACSDDDSSLPPVNGFNSSDEVAADNLLAHWTFDNTTAERFSEVADSAGTGDSFVAGAKGQALNLNNGYLAYPEIDGLNATNSVPSITVSMWINVSNNGQHPSAFFGLANLNQEDWNHGPFLVMSENGKPVAYDDTLVLKAVFSTYIGNTRYGGDNINDFGNRGVDFQTVLGADRWVHYVARYDGINSTIDLYADGIRVSNNNFRNRTYNNGTADVGIGVITARTPLRVIFGGFPNADTGFDNSPAQSWQGLLDGGIDEVRVYDKALTDLEIGSLFQLEQAGR